jgi:uncharacterized membrane protein
MEESRKRTILKGISWRVFSTIQSFIVTFLLTGDFNHTLKLMIILNITGFVVFYFHERLWNRQ